MVVGINAGMACELLIVARLQQFHIHPSSHQNVMCTFVIREMSLVAHWHVRCAAYKAYPTI